MNEPERTYSVDTDAGDDLLKAIRRVVDGPDFSTGGYVYRVRRVEIEAMTMGAIMERERLRALADTTVWCVFCGPTKDAILADPEPQP